MLPDGQRIIAGRHYTLAIMVCAYTPDVAKAEAQDAAKKIRQSGKLARVVKVSPLIYRVFQL